MGAYAMPIRGACSRQPGGKREKASCRVAPPLKALAAIAAIGLWLGLLIPFSWDSGLLRGGIVLVLLLGVVLLRFGPRPAIWPEAPGTKALLALLFGSAVAGALILDIGFAAGTVTKCLKNNEIRMDQGPTLWRAARLLWNGENPYGLGAVVDFYSYGIRASERRAEGIVSSIADGEAAERALERYSSTLDPELRKRLLPVEAASGGPLSEARLLGYKYGPLLIDVTALFAPLGQPCAAVLLNIVMYGVMLLAMARLFWGAFEDKGLAMVGILALLLDPNMSWNYVDLTMADIWSLAFCALGVFAFQRDRPLATGAMIGAAMGCKIFPSLIFVPLLLAYRSPRPLIAATGVAGAIYLPWLAWDPAGVFANIFMWPFVMSKDSTSWTYFAAPQIVLAVRIAALGAFAVLWHRYLTGREERLFWTLAVANTLLIGTGGVFHNNYVPWASIWVVAAVIERYSAARIQWPSGRCAGAVI